jgi:hypothetical protein
VTERTRVTRPEWLDEREPALSEIWGQLLTQFAMLLGHEIALAKAELTAHARQFSLGGMALLTAGLLGLTGWLALLAAAGLGIAQVIPGWLAALIIGAALCLLAVAAAAYAVRRLSGAGQLLPMTADSLRHDVDVIRDGIRR